MLINKIIYYLKHWIPIFQTRDIARNTFALTALDKLLSPGLFFPISTPSLEAFSILQVVNDIIINNKKSIVEIGPGLSTIVLCRLKKLNNLSFDYYAIESNPAWITLLKTQLESEGLADMVTLIYAPLEESQLGYQPGYHWYSIAALDAHFTPEFKVDLVLVDGPPAYDPGIQFSRYPALTYFQKHLSPSFSFYLDDTNRKGERTVIKKWAKSTGHKPMVLSSTFSVLHKDLPFFPFML